METLLTALLIALIFITFGFTISAALSEGGYDEEDEL